MIIRTGRQLRDTLGLAVVFMDCAMRLNRLVLTDIYLTFKEWIMVLKVYYRKTIITQQDNQLSHYQYLVICKTLIVILKNCFYVKYTDNASND